MVVVDNKNMFIVSSCIGEGLHVVYDDMDGDTYLAFWNYGCKDNKTAWKYRLQHIWRIIKYGTPYDDGVTLDETGRTMLMEALKAHGIQKPLIETFTSSS